MRREYYQSHDSSGYRCRVSIEWDTPRDTDLPPEREAKAAEIAEDIMMQLVRKPMEVVQAMLGRSSEPRPARAGLRGFGEAAQAILAEASVASHTQE